MKQTVNCITLRVDCTTVSNKEEEIYGVNTWRFNFYVREEEANTILLHTMVKLSEFPLFKSNICFKKKVNITESNVWSINTIDCCLNDNLGFLYQNNNGLKL